MKKTIAIIVLMAIMATATIACTAEAVKLIAFGKHFSKGFYANGQTWVTDGRATGESELHVVRFVTADQASIEALGVSFPAKEGDVEFYFVVPSTSKGFYAANRSNKEWAAEPIDLDGATGTAEDSLSRLVAATARYKDGRVAVGLTKYVSTDYDRLVTLFLEDGQQAGIFLDPKTGLLWFCTGYGESHPATPAEPEEEGHGTGHRDPEAPQGTGHRDPQVPDQSSGSGTGHRDPQVPDQSSGSGTGHR